MNIEDMVDVLNEDLSREYSHWHFYMQAAHSVCGLHREEMSEFFLEEAAGEMKHIGEFKKLIHGLITRNNLNKTVSTKVADFKNNLTKPLEILEEALKMEDEVVKNYVERIEQASLMQEAGWDVDGKYIELFLEDQVQDSRSDADEILMMIKDERCSGHCC